MKKIPIGIETFKEIRKNNYYYVDKTMFIPLLNSGKYFSLSRPKKFGKSLFIDTLKEAYSGNKELFKGLYLYDNWDWDNKYPVIKLDLQQAPIDTKEKLVQFLISLIKQEADKYSIIIRENYPNSALETLVKTLCEKYDKRVVVLIDNADKPILGIINNQKRAKENKEILSNFYQILKSLDPYLEFIFITGILKILYASVFGGLNNILDISTSSKFSTICGYTQTELENTFADKLEDVNLKELKKWYYGYNWLGEKVYNPLSILQFLDNKIYKPYWFETTEYNFIIKLIKERKHYISDFENIQIGEHFLSYLDIDNLEINKLLFQIGYLTIKKQHVLDTFCYYTLGYPNLEVKTTFANILSNNN